MYFYFNTLNKGLNLSLLLVKWLGWKKNEAELWTAERDDKMAPNLDKVDVLPCRWLNSLDLLETQLKLV